MKTELILQFAGLTHVGLICAGLLMPRAVKLRMHIAGLPDFVRQLFWVYYTFIGLCLVSFGALSFFGAHLLADGSVLARFVCGFLGVFWLVRLFAATFVFDVRPYLVNVGYRVGYQATNIVFAFLPFIYGWVAWKGGGQ